uniref:VHS domain-containing protein n=1 Tax=Biomphalaria glabrata TaxID=6526 RepID=A0A2C9JQL0_BIOGL
MATSDDSLEILLNRATDPSLKEPDWDKIAAFCDKVVMELEGPLLSTRLLAHKIQSPVEKEALYALATLEACVKNCGRYFHQEIGKFRFLNEIIKVVSPKYLGNRTSEQVKKKCIEILYSWYKGLTHEPKIAEAYRMLKAQGIVKEDPSYMDKTFDPFPPPKPRKADFEDDEKAKTLEKLLRSKNPEDLQAANRLIKSMVKEDMEKTEKRSRRINELESVRNQVKLLTEMISQYSSASSSKEELEMMKELYDNLEKQRPNLFRLASDTDENDNDGINDILKANDSVTRVMTLYKETFEGEKPAGDYTVGAKDSCLLDLGLDGSHKTINPTSATSTAGLLENDFKSLGLTDMNDFGNLFNGMSAQQQQLQNNIPMTQVQEIQNRLESALTHSYIKLHFLIMLFVVHFSVPVKLPLNQLAANKAAAASVAVTASTSASVTASATQLANQAILKPMGPTSSPQMLPTAADFSPLVSAEPAPELLPLTDVFVPLEKIQPAPDIPSVTAYEKNNLKVMVHFTKDRPRPDVIAMVISTISTNSSPISGFVLQAAVPKTMKVKLQPPSATDFPAYNPILPPAAITQVMLVANPKKEKVRLKYKLSYTYNNELISDVGDIDGIPVQ